LQAGRGLAAAQAIGLVHHDFKPDNVLVGSDGRVRVSDFGLSRPTGETATTIAGTPGYIAPEQYRRQPLSAASDQFSFCVALHEALRGWRLRERPPTVDVGKPLSLPASLARIVRRGLAADPRARFASMNDLLAALERHLGRVRFLRGAAVHRVAPQTVSLWRMGLSVQSM